jgi:AbrB family looped-hinge helix DNA binding protein
MNPIGADTSSRLDARKARASSDCPALAKSLSDRYYFRNTKSLSIGGAMETVTVSPKFQVVIPKEMRESLKLVPGQKVQALLYENRIELIPVRPVKKMRGFLKGIDTTLVRETDRL